MHSIRGSLYKNLTVEVEVEVETAVSFDNKEISDFYSVVE